MRGKDETTQDGVIEKIAFMGHVVSILHAVCTYAFTFLFYRIDKSFQSRQPTFRETRSKSCQKLISDPLFFSKTIQIYCKSMNFSMKVQKRFLIFSGPRNIIFSSDII